MALLNTFRAARALCLLPTASGALFACGCTPSDRPQAASTPPLAQAQDGPVFVSPPHGTAARRSGEGVTEISGQGPAGAEVSLRNPDGQTVTATADAEGGWVARIAAARLPRLYALTATSGKRAFRGEGALLVNPAPGPAALTLRAGATAVTLSDPTGGLALEALDFDSGGLAVAGIAARNTALRLSLDGRPAAAGQADAAGRFALLAVQADLKPGPHRLRLDDGAQAVEAAFDATAASTGPAPYAVKPAPGGWRVDWSTPGGGTQSSIVFAPPLSPARR